MTRVASKSQQQRFKVHKDPKHKAKSTQVHRDKTVYRRPRADVNDYIERLNEDWQDER